MRPGAKVCLKAGVLAAAALLVYGPALRSGWIWDDVSEITGNGLLRNLSGLAHAWSGSGSLDYLPLKTTVQWMEWRLWGAHPLGYHAMNLALHILGSLLLWRVLARLGVRLAWLGGLLFAVHPLAVDSVAWVSELKNVLSLPLVLMAMLMYLQWDGGTRLPWRVSTGHSGAQALAEATTRPEVASHLNWCYLLSLLLFIAAMLCKGSVVMFPVVLLLYAGWKRGRVARRDALAVAPFLAVSLALGLVTVWFQENRAIEDLAIGQGGAAARLVIAGRAIAFYVGKVVWPAGLLPVYPRWPTAASTGAALATWLAVGSILLCLVRMRRHAWARHALFGVGFFLINLLPVLGFIPMSYMRFSWVADHFAYLPLAGVAGLAAAGLDPLFRGGRMAGWLVAGAVIAALAAGSRAHARMYRDEETLWTRTLAMSPGSWLAENNLGNALFQSGRTAAAFPHFAEAVRLNPGYPEAQDNLGTALVGVGRVREGISHYTEALRLKPDFPMAEYNLGLALCQAGRPGEAMMHLGRAVMLRPGLAGPHNAMGVILAGQGRTAEAIAQIEMALRLDPGLVEARRNLDVLRGRP